jgi:hypothetical protein
MRTRDRAVLIPGNGILRSRAPFTRNTQTAIRQLLSPLTCAAISAAQPAHATGHGDMPLENHPHTMLDTRS